MDKVEIAKLYWDEFKYRHEHFWKLVYWFMVTILLLLIVPYIHPEKILQFLPVSLFLPILAALISLFAAWVLVAEYETTSYAYERFKANGLKHFIPLDFERNKFFITRKFKYNFGLLVQAVFLYVLPIFAILDAGIMIFLFGLKHLR